VTPPTDLDVYGERHNEDGDHQVGDGQRDDEEVGGGAQIALPVDAEADQHVAEDGHQRKGEHQQCPRLDEHRALDDIRPRRRRRCGRGRVVSGRDPVAGVQQTAAAAVDGGVEGGQAHTRRRLPRRWRRLRCTGVQVPLDAGSDRRFQADSGWLAPHRRSCGVHNSYTTLQPTQIILHTPSAAVNYKQIHRTN